MAKLTEQDLKIMSEVLGISKEQLSNMTEEDLRKEANKVEEQIREVESKIEEKDRQIFFLRSENAHLRFANMRLRVACTARQIQIGFLRTIYDIKSFLLNK